MFWRIVFVALLVHSQTVFADVNRYPNGSLYYIILNNFKDERPDELDALAASRFKSEVESRGYRLVSVNGGDIASIKKAAFDASTSIIVISGHGSDSGSVTNSLFEGARLRSIFRDERVSSRLSKVVIGTCYSSCVAERWDLRSGKISSLTFGNFPIGVVWFQDYLASPSFLSQLGSPPSNSSSRALVKTAFDDFRTKLKAAKSMNDFRDAIADFKSHSEFDSDFDGPRIKEAVHLEVLRKPDLTVSVDGFQTAAKLELSPATISELFLRFSRSSNDFNMAQAGLKTMDKLSNDMPIENATSALDGAANLAKSISKSAGSEAALSVLKQIKDEDLRGAFGYQLLKEAKTPRQYLNVLSRLPDTYSGGTFGLLLALNPSADEILESVRRSPSKAIARNNLYLALLGTKDPDAAIKLFRGYRTFATSKHDLEFFDQNLTLLFQTKPQLQHYRAVSSLCLTKLCHEFVARNFVSMANSPEELKAIAKEVRSRKLILDTRIEIAIQSRAAALKAPSPASPLQTQATRLVGICQSHFASLIRGH